MIEQDYKEMVRSRLTDRHKSDDVFLAILDTLVEIKIERQLQYLNIADEFLDIDKATGKNLDFIGKLIGEERNLVNFIDKPYFGFLGARLAEKYDVGYWYSLYKNKYGNLRTLSDEEYRRVLKARVIKNSSDSNRESFVKVINTLTGNNSAIVIETEYNKAVEVKFADSDGLASYYLSKYKNDNNLIPFPMGRRIGITYIDEDWTPRITSVDSTEDDLLKTVWEIVQGVEIDSQRYYISTEPFDKENLPTPVILDSDVRENTNEDVFFGKTYYIRIGAIKGDEERVSEQFMFNFLPVWQYVQHPYHNDPAHTNLTPPTSGWTSTTQTPFNDNNGWTRDPDLSVFWVKKTFVVSESKPLFFKFVADNGCVIIVNGEVVTSSNPDNINTDGSMIPPCFWAATEDGVYNVTIKAYTESTTAAQGGNNLNIIISETPDLWIPNYLAEPVKLRLSSESVVVDSSNRISQVNDISLTTANATQSTNALKPVLQSDSIHFDGVDDYMNIAGSVDLFRNVNYGYLFTVASKNTTDSAEVERPVISWAQNTNSFRLGLTLGSVGNRNRICFGGRRLDTDSYDGVVSTFNVTPNQYYIICGIVNYATRTVDLYVDGELNVSKTNAFTGAGNTSDTSSARVRFASSTGVSSLTYGDVSVKQLIANNQTLSTANRQKLEGWAAWKYDLVANLPPNHPYKLRSPTTED